MKERNIGLGILGLATLIVVVSMFLKGRSDTSPSTASNGMQPVTVNIKLGSEKVGLLEDIEVKKLLQERFNLTVAYKKQGSIDMVTSDTSGLDALWPSSQVAAQMYTKPLRMRETILNSPMTLYCATEVADALIKRGIVKVEAGIYYITDMPKLLELITQRKTWSSIGLPNLNGRVTVYSTNPAQSNSGIMFAGLLANLLNKNEVATSRTVTSILPQLKEFFTEQGYKSGNSDEIFNNFLSVGDQPMIVGYEAQLVEVSLNQPQNLPYISKNVRTLYPKPTVWTQHPLLVLSPNGDRLLVALKSPEFQKLAWERHGFRPSNPVVASDPKSLKITGVPERVQSTIAMPDSDVMTTILNYLKQR
ncbi:hypothetical protein LBMAG21_13130 [Armatimonadota bacterium]|nr:hypothetical protein LBMAG21_13130 [Armatimonadota bacterium]